MSDTSAGLFDGLADAPQGPEKRDPSFIPLAQQEKDRQDMEDLPDAPDAPSLRDFTAWRATAHGATPAHAAEVLRYAANFNLPSKFVADNFDQVKAKAESGEINNRLSYAPTVERFISQDPILGAATKGDLPQLGWIERNITGKWERIPGAQPWTGDPTQQMTRPPDWILKLGQGALEVKQSFQRTLAAPQPQKFEETADYIPPTAEETAQRASEDLDRQQRLDKLFGTKTLPPAEAQAANKKAAEQTGEEIKTTEAAIGPESMAHRIALAPFKMAPYLAGVTAAGAAGGPAGIYGFNWSQTYGNDFEKFSSMRRQDGTPLLTEDEARSLANTTANLSAGLQTLLDAPVLKGLPIAEGLAQKLTGNAVADALGETGVRYVAKKFAAGGIHMAAGAGLMATQAGAERAGEYAARVTHGEEDHASAIGQAALTGFVDALPDFLLMSGYAPARALLEETGRRLNAPRESARLQQITDSARESLLVQHDPGGKAEEMIGAMAADSDAKTVYVTLDQWKKHWQGEGLDPAEVAARVMGDGGQGYAAADASKSDLQIPIEKYVTQLAPKGHTDALQEFVKLSQDGITPAEYKDQIRAQLKLLVDNAPARDAFDAVREDYRARAMAAGVSRTEAQANAEFVARALTLWADSQGQGKSALDLYRENPTEIIGAKGQRLAETQALGVEPAMARAAQGDLQQAAWHGSPHKFERFSMQHIGSGEGAQIFGVTVANLDGVPAVLREDERGFVRIFAGGDGSRSYEINLRNPDRSTLAHETFHVLSVIMGDVAQTAKDPQLKADYEALLGAMGYADHEERQTALDPAKEERGSHWWEQYLAEGKAPTPELAGAFQRFKGWLLKIYKGVQGVATQYRGAYGKELPQLSADVRSIFDRMLASHDAIDAARGSTGGDAFTRELQKKLPAEAAKGVEQGRVYVLTAQEQELAAQMKSAEAAHGLMEKEQAKVRAEVTGEANADPAQRALHFLQTGEFKSLGGELQPVMSEVLKMGDGSVPKIDRQMIVDRYGQEVADALPRDILRHDGVNPDVLAPAFGYASSMEMVHALASLPDDPAAAIEQEVRQRMTERYPNLVNDPHALADAALATVHGEQQATQIVRELRALAEHVDPSLKPKAAAINLKAIREVARRLIADKPVGQLSPDYYLKAEREAAQRAFEAMRKGDTAEAFGERSAQLLNRSLWREAKDAKESADSAVKYLRGQLEDTPRAVLGKAGPEFLAGVDAVLSALRLEKNDQAVQPAPDAGAYDVLAARMKDAQVELDPNDAAALRQLLVQPKDWSKLRLDELQNVRDFVKTARTVARAVNEVNVLGKKLDLAGVTQQLRAEALAGNKDLGPQVDDQSQISRVQRLQAGVRAWDAAALRAETLLRKLGTMGGQLFDNYINARNAKEKLAATILKDFNDSMEKAGKDFRDRLDEVLPLDKDLPQNGTDMGGPRSRRWLMMLALNMGNAGNIQRATEGRGWTVEQVKKVIGQHLSREELGFVQSRWDAMEPLGNLLAEKEARKTGLPLERVVAQPLELTLADGSSITLAGGYFPAKYDPRVSRGGLGAQQEAAGGIQAFYGADYRRATTQKSHVQQRAANYSNIVNLNWSVYPGHIAQVIHDITHDELVSDTAKVFNHADAQYAMRHTLGIEGQQELNTWLKVVATQQTGSAPSSAEKALGPVFSWLRSRVVMSSIVGSAPVLISQVAHPLIAAAGGELGALSAAASLPKALLPDVQQFARDNSPGEIAHREQRATAALNERLRELGAPEKGLLALAGHIVERGMHAVDGYVSTAVWTAAMNDALAMKDENGARVHDEASAYKYADDKLRQIMPTHETAEMPALLRDKGLVGSLLMAHGFQNTLYNIARTSWHERGPIEATGRILAMTLVSGLAGGLLLGHGKEDDETWGQWALRKALASPFELIPFLPNVTEPVIDHLVTGKAKKADVRNAPVLAGVQTLLEGVGSLAGDNATTADKVWTAIELMLFAGKLPSRQISKTGRYLQTEAGNDISHGHFGDVASGLVYGPKAKRKTATPADAATDLANTITR